MMRSSSAQYVAPYDMNTSIDQRHSLQVQLVEMMLSIERNMEDESAIFSELYFLISTWRSFPMQLFFLMQFYKDYKCRYYLYFFFGISTKNFLRAEASRIFKIRGEKKQENLIISSNTMFMCLGSCEQRNKAL